MNTDNRFLEEVKRSIKEILESYRSAWPKCKHGYTATACELGFPGCVCNDDYWRDQEPTP
jgi:hypothetical protein